jgi:hypothetical protein
MVRSALQTLGIEVRRASRPSAVRADARRPSAGLILEFVGTQGVGKSTLFRETLGKRRAEWFFRDHLRDLPIATPGEPWSLRVHRALLFNKTAAIHDSEFDAWQCSYAVGATAQIVRESLYLSSETFSRGFALDEGLFKNLTREVLALDQADADPLWKGRALIYVRAREVETVVRQYQARLDQRRRRGWFQHAVSVDWIAERARADGQVNARLIAEARRRGVPHLVVDAEDPQRENVREIHGFEERLLAGRHGAPPR